MTPPSARFRLRVSPGAPRSEVVGRHGEAWKVRVAAPPTGGRANAALEAFLAGVLAVDRRQLRVVKGAAGRDKIVEVWGRDLAGAERCLQHAAGNQGGRH